MRPGVFPGPQTKWNKSGLIRLFLILSLWRHARTGTPKKKTRQHKPAHMAPELQPSSSTGVLTCVSRVSKSFVRRRACLCVISLTLVPTRAFCVRQAFRVCGDDIIHPLFMLLWIFCKKKKSSGEHLSVTSSFFLSPCSFLWDEYTVEVRINDYLDIICPHYAHGEVSSHAAERYVLYMVEREDYEVCKPHSFDQLRWECSRPFAPHAPEKFSEKFQRFTPFTLGKEFRQGESYYYICKYQVVLFFFVFFFRSTHCDPKHGSCIKLFPLSSSDFSTAKPMHHHGQDCLRLRVDVVGHKGSGKNHVDKSKAHDAGKSVDGGKGMFPAAGGVHNPSNRLPAGDDSSLKK